ncbi:fungal-specific transcription factor domain-containing protein [Aspergillus arachidicola]|uniref:Fungal-specific transcription factor domain-containing protein n=1 Tax=Aspergillus arachidicola TaxID=656916 RepID=A0A5N6YDG5_9EURO|nr:fungal-specific transcription factor domain-containing protein [Aspergillus arachidicola]
MEKGDQSTLAYRGPKLPNVAVAYRDIMMAVTRDGAPLIKSHQFLQLDEIQMPDSHFGLASEILEILFHTATLNQEAKASNEPASPDSENDDGITPINTVGSVQGPDFLKKLLSLEARLKDWTCPPSADISLRQLAESYRGSALIYLYRVMRRAFPLQRDELSSKATTQVAPIMDSVSQIPTRSLPEGTLLFPLSLAGGEATAESHREYIQHRMLDIIGSRGLKNVEVALSVLERLWRPRIARRTLMESIQVDWLDIVRQNGVELSLT